MAYPDSYIYSLTTEGITRVDYYHTEHYHVMHDFMVNPKRMLDILLDTSPHKAAHRTSKKGRRCPRRYTFFLPVIIKVEG